MLICDDLNILYKISKSKFKGIKCLTMFNAVDKTDAHIKKAKNIHGELYSYSKVIYIKAREKVIYTCKIHGDFKQTPDNHLKGQGCPKCKNEAAKIRYTKSLKTFIQEANSIHNKKYLYTNSKYKNALTPIKITCIKHGDFEQTPASHLQGHGCPTCSFDNVGWTHTKWKDQYLHSTYKFKSPYIYIVKLYNDTESFIKIGKSFRPLNQRLAKARIGYDYTILRIITGNVITVSKLELELKSRHKKYKYTPLNKFKGYTECFKLSLLLHPF